MPFSTLNTHYNCSSFQREIAEAIGETLYAYAALEYEPLRVTVLLNIFLIYTAVICSGLFASKLFAHG